MTPFNSESRSPGKERDSETGLDYFGARYYGSSIGRWLSPDWAAKPTSVPYANFGNPQSLNLYSYVQNDPATLGDPDGHVVGIDDATIITVAAITYGALVTYYVVTQPQTQHALRNASNAAIGAITGLFHPDNRKKSVPVPPPATTPKVNQRTPASTSQQGVVSTTTTMAVTPQAKQQVRDNAGGKCEYCGQSTTPAQKSEKGVPTPATEGRTDHYNPRNPPAESGTASGSDNLGNLVHACSACNLEKSNTPPQGTKWELPRMEPPAPK